MRCKNKSISLIYVFTLAFLISNCTIQKEETIIVCSNTNDPVLNLASKELRRYIYHRSNKFLNIKKSLEEGQNAIVLEVNSDLRQQEFSLKTEEKPSNNVLYISGGTPLAALYGAYHFLEKLGIGFAMHGDIIPDEKALFTIPILDEVHNPLFQQRGILPFHDFAEGPDWWEADDYKAYIAQMVKMKMNFLGMHCYPNVPWGPEPTVWMGLPEDVNEDGTVNFSYPASYHTTERMNSYGEKSGSKKRWWGYSATPTSEFSSGANQLFEKDNFGSAFMNGQVYHNLSPETSNELFNHVGRMYNDVFEYAKIFGVKIAMGTETPLLIPDELEKHLQSKGMDIDAPETTAKIYEGMIKRIKKAFPIDYYWAWTSEGWLSPRPQAEVDKTISEFGMIQKAIEKYDAPFTFATCGWVLGPLQQPLLFDQFLDKKSPISCITPWLGASRLNSNFGEIQNRPKWAIPWLEDDTGMLSPQLWAGRLTQDAKDAFDYGCTGLMGIHWRTKILAPNFAVLAEAAWKPIEAYAKKQNIELNYRDLPCDTFYVDWCRLQFGMEVHREMARILGTLDSGGPLAAHSFEEGKPRKMPLPNVWTDGPGGIQANNTPWEKAHSEYKFVDEMEVIRDQVKGTGNLSRFDYWLNSFKYLRKMGEISSVRGSLDETVKLIKKEIDPSKKSKIAQEIALPLRIRLTRLWEEMMTYLLMATDTPGELGTIANLEQHTKRNLNFLDLHDEYLKKIIQKELPKEVNVSNAYLGESRIIVPTKRSIVQNDETIQLKVIILDKGTPTEAQLHWRRLGDTAWKTKPLKHVMRSVYLVELPKTDMHDFEYYLSTKDSEGESVVWPHTAPDINHSIVIQNVD